MNIKEFIESGILEQYVLGTTGKIESEEVERMARTYPEVKNELEKISDTIEDIARATAKTPGKTIKPFLLATIDFMERMEKGEQPTFPPVLNESSTINDYNSWLSREDMILPIDAPDLYAKIIGAPPGIVTAIVWIKEDSPKEVHHDEHERFLIVEGTCDILIEDKVHQLVPGDFFEIPLHKYHIVKVTSKIPCKVILQRKAA
jgi:mannose-6-phosphate isomerase-like protein (cupin superfamily)